LYLFYINPAFDEKRAKSVSANEKFISLLGANIYFLMQKKRCDVLYIVAVMHMLEIG
jgi:hypothetical protein